MLLRLEYTPRGAQAREFILRHDKILGRVLECRVFGKGARGRTII